MSKVLKDKRRFLPRTNKIPILIAFVIFAIYAATLIFPLLWVLVQSFRTNRDFILDPFDFSESVFSLNNYTYVIKTFDILGMFINSIIVAVGGTLTSVFASCCAAYIVSRYEFKGRKFLYALVVFVMIIPTAGSLAASYRLMNDWNLSGHYIGIIIKGATAFDYTFLLLYGFFKNISSAYAEAAKIDGAGHFKIFTKVMMPLALPSVVAVSIVGFIGKWNDYINPYLYLRNHKTLSVGLYLLRSDIGSGSDANLPALFALMVVATIPVIILYSIFQKKIVENTVAGGIKG